jgi:hypothetical protein
MADIETRREKIRNVMPPLLSTTKWQFTEHFIKIEVSYFNITSTHPLAYKADQSGLELFY